MKASNKKTVFQSAGKALAVFGLATALVVPSVSHASHHYDYARVVDVEPVYKTVRYSSPVEACHEEQVAVANHRRSATGPILGAIIGGAIGNAVGHKKRNKQVGTVVGAVLGGSIGADVARKNRRYHDDVRYETRQVCSTEYRSHREERLDHYNVTYQYAGTTYRTRMDRDPGDSLRVRVRVQPAG